MGVIWAVFRKKINFLLKNNLHLKKKRRWRIPCIFHRGVSFTFNWFHYASYQCKEKNTETTMKWKTIDFVSSIFYFCLFPFFHSLFFDTFFLFLNILLHLFPYFFIKQLLLICPKTNPSVKISEFGNTDFVSPFHDFDCLKKLLIQIQFCFQTLSKHDHPETRMTPESPILYIPHTNV